MTFKELLTRFEKMKWSDNILFVDEKDSEKLYIDGLPWCKVDYNQQLHKDNYDNSYIVRIDDKNFAITKRITEDDII